MENINQKAYFLRNDYLTALQSIDPATLPAWGKMDLQQMIEHMSYSFRQANGKDVHTTIVTPEEHVPKMHAFLMTEKPFRENTINPMLPETPDTHKHGTMQEALLELKVEIDQFFKVFETNPNRKFTNPLFGELTYEMWVQLLYKHAVHHLAQYGFQPA
ncbi:MAG: hypothetical protein EOP51_07535 [Sphingobacteriales bacterium]|nr:MAG: hypothetical protein EOP51_07535 [Sphingobacteriales bacterium]